jgi:hypothetical protein
MHGYDVTLSHFICLVVCVPYTGLTAGRAGASRRGTWADMGLNKVGKLGLTTEPYEAYDTHSAFLVKESLGGSSTIAKGHRRAGHCCTPS